MNHIEDTASKYYIVKAKSYIVAENSLMLIFLTRLFLAVL